MARKSRRNIVCEEEQAKSAVLLPIKAATAAYARLSGESSKSDSVETQIMMIQDYVAEHTDLELVDTYADIGVSGTTFDRPEFNRLMSDVQCGKIQCIIVKDLSRFGRNYIEAGYYLETILPRLNVRLISINDRFDSDNEDDRNGLQIPIKNMVNAMYAMDASKKFSESYDLHFKMGTYKLRTTTYGYVIDKDNNRYTPDPEPAAIVQVVFQWYLLGYSMSEIATLLNGVGATIPFQVKAQHEKKKERYSDSDWNCGMIKRIIECPTYTGDLIHNRRRHRKYTDDVVRRVDPDEWIVKENTHEPLISHEVFYDALKRKNQKKNDEIKQNISWVEPRTQPKRLFYKKLVCAECGNTMRYQNGGYMCFHEKHPCCKQKVKEDEMLDFAMKQIKVQMKTICSQKALANSVLDETNPKGKAKSLRLKIQNANRKLTELQKTTESLYINLSDGIITEEEYKELNKHYSLEKENYTNELKSLNHQVYLVKKAVDRFEDLIQRYDSFVDSTENDRRIIEELIDKILVYKCGAYEVVFNCVDVISQFEEALKE